MLEVKDGGVSGPDHRSDVYGLRFTVYGLRFRV
jgi:hypothetical protein